MTVTKMSKRRPRIDIERHTSLDVEHYDVRIIFGNGNHQFWSKLTEEEVRTLCEKYNPISTPLSVAIAPRFLPKRNIEKPKWEVRKV